MRRRLLIAVPLVLMFAGVAFVALRTPSNERVWPDHFAKPAGVSLSVSGTQVSFAQVRNYTYDAMGPVTKEYVSRTYDLDSITGMRFLMEPFPDNASFGHTLLIFDFENAPSIAFSIEARMEAHETYSPYAGLFNEFELSYTWGTEEDFITRRSVYLAHEVYIYDLALSKEVAQKVFLAFAMETDELEAHPRFYNTLLHNCTNELANVINKYTAYHLPWDFSRIFTGTADKYLFDLGYIKGATFEEAKESARIR
jgi:hypothetical protein